MSEDLSRFRPRGGGSDRQSRAARPGSLRGRNPKESDLHRTVADYLDLALIPPTWWTTFPSDGARWHGLIGLKLGVPDILIVHAACAYWIELKSPRGRQSLDQFATAYALRDSGCGISLCRSLEEVIDDLRLWGIPLRPIELVA